MTTIQTTRMPARIRRTSAVLTAAGTLIAVGIAALFLTLASPTRSSHTAIRHPAPTYQPLIQYRGTDAPPATATGARATTPTDYPLIQYRGTGAPPATATGARATTPTLVNPRLSYPVH
jgi:hypothetical protein